MGARHCCCSPSQHSCLTAQNQLFSTVRGGEGYDLQLEQKLRHLDVYLIFHNFCNFFCTDVENSTRGLLWVKKSAKEQITLSLF